MIIPDELREKDCTKTKNQNIVTSDSQYLKNIDPMQQKKQNHNHKYIIKEHNVETLENNKQEKEKTIKETKRKCKCKVSMQTS